MWQWVKDSITKLCTVSAQSLYMLQIMINDQILKILSWRHDPWLVDIKEKKEKKKGIKPGL